MGRSIMFDPFRYPQFAVLMRAACSSLNADIQDVRIGRKDDWRKDRILKKDV